MGNLLTEREFQVYGGWYEPKRILLEFASVAESDYLDTSSSAGEWSGYFVQVIGNIAYLIDFYQSNNWPDAGYTVYTGDVQARWRINKKTFNEDIRKAVKQFLKSNR